MEIISVISNLVEESCKKDTNIFGYEIWSHHILTVLKYSRILAEKFNANLEIAVLSALLHDYASIKDKSLYKEHHLHGATEAENLLKTFDYPEKKIELIKQCIISHRGSINIKKESTEAIIIGSADAMSHIEEIPSLFHLAYTKHNMSADDESEWVENKIDRSWKKLCPEAQEIMRDKYNSLKKILAK